MLEMGLTLYNKSGSNHKPFDSIGRTSIVMGPKMSSHPRFFLPSND